MLATWSPERFSAGRSLLNFVNPRCCRMRSSSRTLTSSSSTNLRPEQSIATYRNELAIYLCCRIVFPCIGRRHTHTVPYIGAERKIPPLPQSIYVGPEDCLPLSGWSRLGFCGRRLLTTRLLWRRRRGLARLRLGSRGMSNRRLWSRSMLNAC